MNKKTVKYSDEDLGEVTIVNDFLPRPDELVLKEKTIKVTLSLSEDSVSFFKKAAKKNHTQYQKMIRILIDKYVDKYKKTG
jgi:predicted DNA binding CopG/RHH family protein